MKADNPTETEGCARKAYVKQEIENEEREECKIEEIEVPPNNEQKSTKINEKLIE